MSCYISSNENRFYVGLEQDYGSVAAITGKSRIPAVKLSVRQQLEKSDRKDKTGGRTFAGIPAGIRRRTNYDLTTYMTGWTDTATEPGYGPLFQAALGSAAKKFAGGVAQGMTGSALQFSGPHGLAAGQAITFGSELRFVTAVADAQTVQLNAPFTVATTTGSPIGATVSYAPATDLPSVSIFDYWSPDSAVQRAVAGAAVSKMRIKVNDAFHEFQFSGPSADVLDSASFTSGEGSLTQFPDEPAASQWDYSIIPGHLGQAWIGNTPTMFYTVTEADFTLDNDIDPRAREFGSSLPRCLAPGRRSVTMNLSLFEADDNATKALYQAARQRSPLPVMFQLGAQAGQLFGIYMKSVVPEIPEFDDSERRLQWKFSNSRAQGTHNDEIHVAFG